MNEIVMERDLVALPEPKNALATFTTDGAIEPILADVRRKVDAFLAEGHGVDTAAGRDTIKSFAFKVTKSKTALEEVGKELAAEQKKIPALIDATRRHIKETLDAWRDEVRKPVTDWEAAEEARVGAIKALLEELQGTIDDPSWTMRPAEVLRDRLGEVERDFCNICEAKFGEYVGAASELKAKAVAALTERVAAAEKREADAAELSALRAEADARAKKDRDDRIASEAAAKAKADAEAAVQVERDAAAKREADLKAAAEAAEQAKADAENRASRAAAEAKEAAERKVREDKEREEAAQLQREQDKAHRATINREALAALVKGGVDIEVAKTVIVLIATRAVPHISINY